MIQAILWAAAAAVETERRLNQLERADHRNRRQSGFDPYSRLDGNARGIIEPGVYQDDAFVFQYSRQGQKGSVMDVGKVSCLTTSSSSFMPTIQRQLLLPFWPVCRKALWSNGRDQFDPIVVNHNEKGRLSQAARTARLMNLQAGKPANRAAEFRFSQR